MEYESILALFQRFAQAFIWKLGSGSASGSASWWKFISGSASNKNQNPDLHQGDADPQHWIFVCPLIWLAFATLSRILVRFLPVSTYCEYYCRRVYINFHNLHVTWINIITNGVNGHFEKHNFNFKLFLTSCRNNLHFVDCISDTTVSQQEMIELFWIAAVLLDSHLA